MDTNHQDSLPDDASDANGTDWFWKPRRPPRPIEEIAAEQGAPLIADFDAMFGEGKDLWDSDEEFEEWMKYLEQSRREGR